MSKENKLQKKNRSKEGRSRKALALLGIVVAALLASCGPTEAEYKAGLGTPIITSSGDVFYFNSDPFSFSADFANANRIYSVLSPSGGLVETSSGVKVSNLPYPNTEYSLSLQAKKCGDYKGKEVCSDPVVSLIKLVYDTIPPEFNTESVTINDGKVILSLVATDNLSGVDSVEIGGKTFPVVNNRVLAEFTPYTVGDNEIEAKGTDRAGNTGEKKQSIIYNPFTSVKVNHVINPDGSITFLATGDSSINIEGTKVGGTQQVVPLVSSPGKVVNCVNPQTNNGIFSITCSPPNSNGFVTLSVDFVDKNGFTQSQEFKIKDVPDLTMMTKFGYLLTSLLITGASITGAYKRVKKIQESNYREMTTEMSQAVLNRYYDQVRERLILLRKKDIVSWEKYLADAQTLDQIQIELNNDNLASAYLGIDRLVKDTPRRELWQIREQVIEIWLGKFAFKLKELIEGKNAQALNENRGLLDIVIEIAYNEEKNNILWTLLRRKKELIHQVFELAFVFSASQGFFWNNKGEFNLKALSQLLYRYPMPNKNLEGEALFKMLCDWSLLNEANNLIFANDKLKDQKAIYIGRLRQMVIRGTVDIFKKQSASNNFDIKEISGYLNRFQFMEEGKYELIKQFELMLGLRVALIRTDFNLAFHKIQLLEKQGLPISLKAEFQGMCDEWFKLFFFQAKPILESKNISLLMNSKGISSIIRSAIDMPANGWFWGNLRSKGENYFFLFFQTSFVVALYEGNIWKSSHPPEFSEEFLKYFTFGGKGSIDRFDELFGAAVDWNLLNQAYKLVTTNEMGDLKNKYIKVIKDRSYVIIMAAFDGQYANELIFNEAGMKRLVEGFEFLNGERASIVGNFHILHRQIRVLVNLRFLKQAGDIKLTSLLDDSLKQMHGRLFNGNLGDLTSRLFLGETLLAIYRGDRSQEKKLESLSENEQVLAFDFFLKLSMFETAEKVIEMVKSPLNNLLRKEYDREFGDWQSIFRAIISRDPKEALDVLKEIHSLKHSVRQALEEEIRMEIKKKETEKKMKSLKDGYKGKFPEALFSAALNEFGLEIDQAIEVVPIIDSVGQNRALLTGEIFHLIGLGPQEAIELKARVGDKTPATEEAKRFMNSTRKVIQRIIEQCGLITARSDENKKTGTYMHSNFTPTQRFMAYELQPYLTKMLTNKDIKWWSLAISLFIKTIGKNFNSKRFVQYLY